MPASLASDLRDSADHLQTAQTIQIDILNGSVDIIDPLADEWRSLSRRAANSEVSYRPEWLQTWLRAFEPTATLTLLTARADVRLVAVLPLIIRVRLVGGIPARLAVSPTNHHSCRFDLLYEDSPQGEAAIGRIWESLVRNPGWDCLQFSYAPDGGALDEMTRLAHAAQFPVWRRQAWSNAYITTDQWDGTPDYWLKQTSPKFERNVRRLRRKCADESEIRLERVDSADPAALEEFYGIESSGWKGERETGIKAHADTLRFYNQIAQQAAHFGYLSIYFLYLGEQLAAAQFGFRYNGKFIAAKCAFDEKFRSLSPGHLIVDSILQDCGGSKLRELELGGEFEEWKTKWTSLTHNHSSLFIFRNSLYGRFLYHARARLVPAAGRLIRRLEQIGRKLPQRH